MTIRTIFATAIIVASFHVQSDWDSCAEAHGKTCVGSGCFAPEGAAKQGDVFDVCGPPPHATGAEKREVMKQIALACQTGKSFDSAAAIRDPSNNFANSARNLLWYVSFEDAVKACDRGQADGKREAAIAAKARVQHFDTAVKDQARRDAISVTIGSPESNVIAKFGPPDEINRTVNRSGVHKQMVYGSTYIYTENGIVTSWQD